MTRSVKIAISLPHDDLAAADRLAARLGRSRSWVMAEALRRFVAHERLSGDLDASRTAQLRRDLALSAEERLRDAEEIAHAPPALAGHVSEPRRFATYEAFAEWRRAARSGG